MFCLKKNLLTLLLTLLLTYERYIKEALKWHLFHVKQKTFLVLRLLPKTTHAESTVGVCTKI